jgi:protein-S-isoprenylcysteine O-methyltransferase Ste14
MGRLLIFVAATALLAWLSRRTLRVPGSHGFYRFFAEECIAALLVLDFVSFRHWFADPFSPRQLVSWFLLCVCIVPGVLGAIELRREGGPGGARPDEPWLYEFERTTRLVTTGVYERIRHPLYASLLLLAWGVFFKRPSWLAGLLGVAASAFLVATARAEERENLAYFGAEYAAYQQATRMFIPHLL